MKNVALSVVLACASMACASTQSAPATTAGSVITTASEPGKAPTIATQPVEAKVSQRPWLGAAAASQFVLVGGQPQFVGVWVDVPKGESREHVPMSVTLTIDTSGSMAGDKMDHARHAASTLVRQMQDGDMIAIHEFNNSAREIVGPMVLGPHSRAQLLRVIAKLQPAGSTNMEEGLGLALRSAQATPSTHPVRRVVLISDGRATVGQTNAHVLGSIAEHAAPSGVQVTSLGVGLDYDEETLNQLAVRSSGRLYHLADSREMAGILETELALLQSTMGTNAFVELVPAPGVRLHSVGGVRTEWGQNGALRVPLGTVFGGQRRELLVRFSLMDEQVEGSRPIMSARLHFNDPSDGGVPRVHEAIVRAERTTDAALVQSHPNPAVQAIVAMQEAADIAAAARKQVDDGRFDEADLALSRAEKQLRDNAALAKSPAERERMTAAAKRVSASRHSVQEVKAAPAPARAKAARASSLQLNDAAMEARGF